MYYTYILKSSTGGKYYTGYTSDIDNRLRLHNFGKVASTKNDRPWELFYYERFVKEVGAIRREKQIKKWKSRKAIERLKFCNKIEDPRF